MPHDPFYTSTPWRKVRQAVLRRDRYICRHCGVKCLGHKKNLPNPHVDHVINRKKRPDLALNPGNLVTLCPPCHSKKTQTYDVVRKGNPIGLDGFPIVADPE